MSLKKRIFGLKIEKQRREAGSLPPYIYVSSQDVSDVNLEN